MGDNLFQELFQLCQDPACPWKFILPPLGQQTCEGHNRFAHKHFKLSHPASGGFHRLSIKGGRLRCHPVKNTVGDGSFPNLLAVSAFGSEKIGNYRMRLPAFFTQYP